MVSNNKILLIGARGVGKTSLLQRLQRSTHFSDFEFVDLDQFLEKKTGQSIFQIFKAGGQSQFRVLEVETLNGLLEKPKPMVISVGAGINLDPVTRESFRVWVRRPTDTLGRIFLDRPRLLEDLDPHQEFLSLHQERNSNYARWADQVYRMPEGLSAEVDPTLLDLEARILSGQVVSARGFLTKTRKNRDLPWPGQIEIRTDQWDLKELKAWAHDSAWAQRRLWSFRETQNTEQILESIPEGEWIDWAFELGSPPNFKSRRWIHSIHERKSGASISEVISCLMTPKASHYKLCPEITSWTELREGFAWQSADPENRSFLPRSTDGRWKWFRLFSFSRQKINFVHDGWGLIHDQPSLFESLMLPEGFKNFAAVLGDPVLHSHSPVWHFSFFQKRLMPVFAIPISQVDWPQAFPLLKELGLKAAAVTSPLKFCFDPRAPKNTWVMDSAQNQEHTANTDSSAMIQFLQRAAKQKTVIWGGGGTLPGLKAAVPQGYFYSVRSGEPRDGSKACLDPEVLVWAAGPRDPGPSQAWQPRLVIDLNYREDSEARSYALKARAEYISGDKFFQLQAQGQQEFWSVWLASSK